MAKAKRVRIPLLAELIDPAAGWSGVVFERADQMSKRGGTRRLVRARNTAGETREYNVLRLKLVDSHVIVMERPRRLFFPSRIAGGILHSYGAAVRCEPDGREHFTPAVGTVTPRGELHVEYLPGEGPAEKVV